MGQHKRADTNKRPNNVSATHKAVPMLCIVCNNPSAIFSAEDKKVYRLAKTMRRITMKSAPEVMYVHDIPCLNILVQNWAGIIAEHEAKKHGVLKRDAVDTVGFPDGPVVGAAVISEPLAEEKHEA